MPTNYITLPRSQLYELVWSKPVTELAKEFGISDVALASEPRSGPVTVAAFVAELSFHVTRPLRGSPACTSSAALHRSTVATATTFALRLAPDAPADERDSSRIQIEAPRCRNLNIPLPPRG